MKKYLYILISIIFLSWGVILLKAKSDSTSVKGFLKANDAVMNIEDVVSVWSENERLLTLYLFPFELSEQDIQMVVSDSLFSYRVRPNPTPEQSKWHWCPYGEIRIWLDENEHKSVDSITRYFVLMKSIRSNISSDNINKVGKDAMRDHRKLLVLLQNGHFVEASISGESTILNNKYSWNIDCKSDVYVK